MADNSSVWFNGGFVRNLNPGLTQRFALGTCSQHVIDGTLVDDYAETKVYHAGTISHLAIMVTANVTTTATATVTLMKNGVATALTFTIPTGATGVHSDTTHSVSVSANDILYVRTVHSSVFDFAIEVNNLSAIYTPTDTSITVTKTMADQYSAFVSVPHSTTRYIALHGFHDNGSTSQTARQDCVPIDCTAKNLRVSAIGNSFNGATVFTLQKNGVDTALTLSVPAGSTSFVEDAVNTVAFSAHDEAGWKVDTTGSTSGGMNIANVSGEWHSANEEWFLGTGQQTRTPSGASAAVSVGGENYFLDTEAEDRWAATMAGRAKGLCVNIRVNSATGNTHFRWRNGGVNGNIDVVIPAGQTGFFNDAGTDEFFGGDLLSIAEFTTQAGAISFSTIDWIGTFAASEEPNENLIECPHGSFQRTLSGSGSGALPCPDGSYSRTMPAQGSYGRTHVGADGSYLRTSTGFSGSL